MSIFADAATEITSILNDEGVSLTVDGVAVKGFPRMTYQGAQFGLTESAGMQRTFRCPSADLEAIPAGLGSVVVHDGNTYAIQHIAPDEQTGTTVIELVAA